MQQIVIPYGAYWSTPFARWQGSLADLHSVKLAAHVARDAMARRNIDPTVFDHAVLGTTVPQKNVFFGAPWLMGMLGAPGVGGPTVNQACATGARSLHSAASEITLGGASVSLVTTADRTSNGPHVYYPAPSGTGGTGEHENWVLDNFQFDPFSKLAMIGTAENVAARHGFSKEQQHELVLHRHEQYQQACANDQAFLRRYMDLPFNVPDARFRKTKSTMQGDEGIHVTTAEGLASLKPVREGGTVTFGAQTHPADGVTAMVVTTPERASELSQDNGIKIRILGFSQARVEPGYMPEAPVPAAERVLKLTGKTIGDIDVIKTHNPFAVNDLVFAKKFGIDTKSMNNYGCSLVWGHPQGPTGLRAIIEMIEELVIRGGGCGLFTGCAAGDSAMAAILEVTDNNRA